VKPVEGAKIIAAKDGPEQEQVFEPKPRPPQVAVLEQETAVEEKRSSGQALGGDTTAQSAYLRTLRSRLEHSKVKPPIGITGTAVVHFVVDASGHVISREVKLGPQSSR
jgi:hypothetical protein